MTGASRPAGPRCCAANTRRPCFEIHHEHSHQSAAVFRLRCRHRHRRARRFRREAAVCGGAERPVRGARRACIEGAQCR
ncbi:Thiazole biosynthesis protein ThiG [Caballeronia sordidicola]|uniref:Thiazole biosynthesis protein ThiG n=1 Tax=Caballeronia sordidicola TaxID=196367 RepID=A0A242MII4_CABSO|nr:Thiazole biosynthesis protein ThiG [Caballeronia sordidicola]